MVEATNNSSFKDLVNEQKEANKQSGFIKDILSKMFVSQQQEVVDKQNTNAKETEDKREQNRLFKGIKVGLMGISSKVGGMYRFLEQSALDAAKKVGGGFLDIAKKFIFGGAIIAVLQFIDSEDWEKIKEVSEKLLIKLKEFVKSPFWTNLKNFVTDPSWENLGQLFKDNFLATSALVGIIGGYAIFKLVRTAKLLRTAFLGLGKGLTSLTDTLTGTTRDSKGRIRDTKTNRFAPKSSRGILNVAKGGAKLIPGLGLAITGIFGVIDGVTAGMEEAKKEGATKTSILREGIAGTLSGLTFGFVGQDQISDGLSSLGTGIKNAFTPSEEFKKKMSEVFNLENIKTNMKNLGSKIKETFTPSDEFKERIGKVFNKENIISSLTSIGNKAKESFGLSDEFVSKIAGVKDTFTTGLTSTFKTVGNFFNDKFKFDSKEETIASAINAVTLPANIVKDSLLGAGALLATRLGFDETSETIQNLNQKSIGQLVTDSFNGIFGFFKDLLDFDFKDLVRKIPFGDKVLGFLGQEDDEPILLDEIVKYGDADKELLKMQQEADLLQRKIKRNTLGSVGFSANDEKQALKLLNERIKELQEEIAESKRTGTSGNTIINNNNVVGGSGGGRGGSGGTGIMPFPVKDNTIPNFTFPI